MTAFNPLSRSLLGVKRTFPFALHMSAFDPKRTSCRVSLVKSALNRHVTELPHAPKFTDMLRKPDMPRTHAPVIYFPLSILMGLPMRCLTAAIATASMIALTQVAAAADMPVKAPVRPVAPAVIPYNWTGFYIGGHFGCGWVDQTIKRITVEDDEPPESAFVNIETSGNGCFGGGQIGYNYQFANNVVLGIEADASWGSINGSGSAPEGDFDGAENLIPFDQKLKSFGTVRGRLGYAFGQWLPYVTGGWAWGRNKLTVYALDDDLITSDTRTHSGWTVGAGLEYLINRNWSVKVEYLYLDLGTETYNNVAFFDAAFPGADIDLKLHTIKLGLNYKFDWGVPMRP